MGSCITGIQVLFIALLKKRGTGESKTVSKLFELAGIDGQFKILTSRTYAYGGH